MLVYQRVETHGFVYFCIGSVHFLEDMGVLNVRRMRLLGYDSIHFPNYFADDSPYLPVKSRRHLSFVLRCLSV